MNMHNHGEMEANDAKQESFDFESNMHKDVVTA
jgi:hypothetical protein